MEIIFVFCSVRLIKDFEVISKWNEYNSKEYIYPAPCKDSYLIRFGITVDKQIFTQ